MEDSQKARTFLFPLIDESLVSFNKFHQYIFLIALCLQNKIK